MRFHAATMGAITVPVAIYAREEDSFLVPRFHAQWVMQNMRGQEVVPGSLRK